MFLKLMHIFNQRITVIDRGDDMDQDMTTTAFELKGHRTVRSLGVVRGIVVRSRSLIGNIGAAIQSLYGGNITIYPDLCERARQDAFEMMVKQAEQSGANAVIGVRYDATEIASGITEVICYGTAVEVDGKD
ncbi:Putative heavy-metal-binding protein [uncultured archaeon]|nr:Putative heavy-metal-binding protein [uncultured archaeon]